MLESTSRIIEIKSENDRETFSEIIQRACKEYVSLSVANNDADEDVDNVHFSAFYHERNHDLEIQMKEILYKSSDKYCTIPEITIKYVFKIGLTVRPV